MFVVWGDCVVAFVAVLVGPVQRAASGRNKMLTFSVRGAVGAAALACFTTGAHADDLLIVDLSVPNQITINSTAGLSAATVSGSDTTGVYFDNFYGVAGNALADVLVSGDITNVGNPSDFTPDLFRGGSGTDTGLNLWSWSSDFTVDFTAGSQAFSGTGTWTLSAAEYADMLAGNMSGNLYFPADTSDDVANATLLGTYKVIVPAPASAALLGIGGLAAVRRRR